MMNCQTCGSEDVAVDHVKGNVYAVDCDTCGARTVQERELSDAIESAEYAYSDR